MSIFQSALTPAQSNRNNRVRQSLDTPTPAPSSGHTSAQYSSLKPSRSNTNLSYMENAASRSAGAAAKATRFNQNNNSAKIRINSNRTAFSQLNGQIPEINTEELDLDNLEIATDGSERERRTLEEEIRRGMGELERRDSSAASSTEEEMMEGADGRRRDAMDFRARMEDESEPSSRDSNSEVEHEEDFSLHIGMTRSRPQQPTYASNTGAAPMDDDLTYLTLSTTPASPRRFAAPPTSRSTIPNKSAAAFPPPPPVVTANPSTARPPRSLRKEFERADTHDTAPQPLFGENVPLSSGPLPSSSSTHRPSASVPNANNPPQSLPRGPSRFATYPPRSAARTVAFGVDGIESDSPDERTSRMRLPDVTGLTEGLMSPAKARERGLPPVARGALREEGNAVSNALDQLRKRLASLERENAVSASRVRELESKLGEEQQQNDMSRASKFNNAAATSSSEFETKLKEEQEKREALESLVERLRSHVTHLAHSLESHSTALSSLRAARSVPVPQVSTVELEREVASLRSGLEGLGDEVEAVRNVVEELVRERGVSGKEWEREEVERRDSMREEGRRSTAPPPATVDERLAREDVERTPKVGKGWKAAATEPMPAPETPRSGRSFISGEEIERLRAELAREESRRSPTPRTRKTNANVQPPSAPTAKQPCSRPHLDSPLRPATAPLPTSRPNPLPTSHPRECYESITAPIRKPTQPQAQAPANANVDDDDLRDTFRRADEIFRSVSAPAAKGDENASPGICSVCRRRKRNAGLEGPEEPNSAPAKMERAWERNQQQLHQQEEHDGDDEEEMEEMEETTGRDPRGEIRNPTQQYHHSHQQKEKRMDPQAALGRVLKDLEADFELHKKIYIELSDQYRAMDAKVGGGKRRVLADHLKESIDTLELKADQVRRLHDLLHFKGSPTNPPAAQFGAGRMREGVI